MTAARALPALRTDSAGVAYLTGFSLRKVQAKSEQGKIPSAAKLADGTWTYNIAAVKAWIKAGEDAVCPTISTKEGAPGTREFRSTTRTIDEAYERFLSGKRANA